MKLYGHPWSTNSRKSQMTFAEKGSEPEFKLVMLPKGEHKQPDFLALHPFGKVPVLDDRGFVLYETRAINEYVDRTLDGPALKPDNTRDRAVMDQWINVADAYFVPFAQGLIVELLFRKYLGGEQSAEVIRKGRDGMQGALDVLDRRLGSSPYLAGSAFSLADIHWMPYFEYVDQIGEGDAIARRQHLNEWWRRVAARPTWQKVARTGPQAYEPGMTADVVEKQHRR